MHEARIIYRAVLEARRGHLDAFRREFSVERVGVIIPVADQPSWWLTGETRLKSVSDKGDFMRASRRRVGGERETMKVRHHHEFRAFAPLSRTNSVSPFFAKMNVPSIKHSERSKSPRGRRGSIHSSQSDGERASLMKEHSLQVAAV